MSTESENAVHDGSNASKIEVKNDQKSESLAGQYQELDRDEQEVYVTAEPGNGSFGIETMKGFTDLAKEKESVNGGLDLGTGSLNVVDEGTKESEKKVQDDSEEVVKDSDGIDKEVDSKRDCSGKQGTKAEDLDNECFMGLEPHQSKDESSLDNETSPATTEVKLSDSDLVWAKVRSHPWWPGQVFDASAATDKAKKYFKKGSYLVTYFGDCSFAWNDASRLKPFRQHFSQMSKQSTLPDFLDAIDFVLEEVSRRIEFGLACSCISEEVYEKIKTQSVINPGIREDSSSVHGGDKVSSAVFFEPANLVDYVKRLACSPSYNATDELEFVSQRAKLLAFNRWKGYSDLPEFEILQGSVESAIKISPAEKEESSLVDEVKESVKKTEQVHTKKRKTEGQGDCKKDGVFEYEDTAVPKKKEKTLAEFIAEKRLIRSNGKRSDKKPDCEKKRKVVQAELPKSSKKIKAKLDTEDSKSPLSPRTDRKCNLSAGDKITPKKAKTSFGIGASILRVANQMHCSTPTGPIPCSNSTSKMAAKNNGSGKSLQGRPKAEALSATKPSPKPSTNLVEDSVLESRDLKGSSKEEMVNEDRNEDATTVGEMSIKESNLSEEKITGLDLKEQPGNKNCSE